MKTSLAVVVVALATLFFLVNAEVTPEDVRKMNIKGLKQFLSERGLTCDGCAEKRDYLDLALNNIDTPVVAKPAAKEFDGTHEDEEADAEDVEDEVKPKKEFKEPKKDEEQKTVDTLLHYLRMSNPSLTEEQVRQMLNVKQSDLDGNAGGTFDDISIKTKEEEEVKEKEEL